jgi:hypothetical protein
MWRPVGLSGVVATATSSTSKHPINDRWACSRRSPFYYSGRMRCTALGLLARADSWYGGNVFFSFFPPGPGERQASNQRTFFRHGHPWRRGPPRNTQRRWQLLAVAESVAGRRACGVPGPCPAGRRGLRGEERRGHARFVLRVQTPMRATGLQRGLMTLPLSVCAGRMRGGVAGPGPWRWSTTPVADKFATIMTQGATALVLPA